MTMQVQITNLDNGRTAKVEVQDFNIDRRTIACVDSFLLSPGESRSVWIHAARKVEITEDPLVQIQKPVENADDH